MPATRQRLLSLDTFRGYTLAAMILVNTPGSWSYVYAPLRHAKWEGCTPTDLIFPFFLFITGVAMWFSLGKRNAPASALLPKLAKRVALIFLIGLAINAFPFVRDYADLRIPGVLQRIALCYGVVGVGALYLCDRQLLALGAVFLVGYWGLLFAFSSDPYALEHNLVGSLDRALLGPQHLYRGHGIPFDPEGLLSTLPACVSTLAGFLTGKWVSQTSNTRGLPLQLLGAGLLAVVVGLVWGLFFPINKALWSSSYVVYTTGWAWLCLGAFVWLIDVKGFLALAKPACVLGTNSLFVYVLSMVWVLTYVRVIRIPGSEGPVNGYHWLFSRVFEPLAGSMNGSLLFALFHVGIFWLIAYALYRKQFFIKI